MHTDVSITKSEGDSAVLGRVGGVTIPPVVARIFSGDSTSPLTREARALVQGKCGSADAKQAEIGFCLAYMLSSA